MRPPGKAGRRHRRRSLFKPFRRDTKPGADAGTIVPSADAQRPVIRIITYTRDSYHRRDDISSEAIQKADQPQAITWLDIDGVGDAQIVKRIGDQFGLHALALEDVVNVHQRSKVEAFDDHLFVVSRMVSQNNGQLETEQITLFLGHDYVVTFQERLGDCLDPVRNRLARADSPVRKRGPEYLMYALLDAIVDGYFPVLEAFGNQLDLLEDQLESGHTQGLINRLHAMRGELLLLRRSLWPQREAIAALLRDEHVLITSETRLYLRDVYDHVVQLIDVTETYREICADLRDLYYAQISQRTNDVMRVLTIIATIFMPLSFIAGVYGMNFDTEVSAYNMPELHWKWGYPFALALMAMTVGIMLTYFYRRGWLRRSST